MADKSLKPPIDVSLKLWSSFIPLGALLCDTSISVKHLYAAGKPIALEGRFAGRIADDHYAVSEGVRCSDDRQVGVCVSALIAHIESHCDLAGYMKSGEIRGELWVVRLHGDHDTPMPAIAVESVARAKDIKLRIFLENYTEFNAEGSPMKTWLS